MMILNLLLALILSQLIVASPQIGLPFQFQSPDVAVVLKSYSFTLAPTTFRSDRGSISLSLQDAPSWLRINSSTCTLYGIPGSEDRGNTTFKIVANDSAGSMGMSAVILVADRSKLVSKLDVNDILTQVGVLAGSASLLLRPLNSFSIDFRNMFATTGKDLSLSVAMHDHTPVPAWINFDAANSRMSGLTPNIDANPQRLEIDIIASETPGFASARTPIVLSVSKHRFHFDQIEGIANIPAGASVNISALKTKMLFDGNPVTDSDFLSASARTPSWLTFDSQEMSLKGTPPEGFGAENITLFAYDKHGDTASMTLRLNLGFGRLFAGAIGVLNVTAGQDYRYRLSKADFIGEDLDVKFDFGEMSEWFHYDTQDMAIIGKAPATAIESRSQASVTVIDQKRGVRDFQTFDIQLGKMLCNVRKNEVASAHKTVVSKAMKSATRSKNERKLGLIIGLAVGITLFIGFVILAVLCILRRRQRNHDPNTDEFRQIERRWRLPFDKQRGSQYIWPVEAAEGDMTYTSATMDVAPKVSLNLSAERLNTAGSNVAEDARSIRSRLTRRLSGARHQSGRSPNRKYEASRVHRFQKAIAALRHNNEEDGFYSRALSSPLQHYPDGGEIDRTPYAESPSIIQSVDTDILLEDEDDDLLQSGSLPQTPCPVFQLPARNHLFNGHRGSFNSGMSNRPLPRRGPYHSSFFAGGSRSRRRKNASIAENVLSTIDGSSDSELGEGVTESLQQQGLMRMPDGVKSSDTLQRQATQSTTRDWETTTSKRHSFGSPSTQRQRRWSSRSQECSRYGSPWHRNVHNQRQNMVNTWYGISTHDYAGRSASSSIYSWSPPRGSSSVLDLSYQLDAPAVINALQTKIPEHIPIMERPRAAYRMASRSPFTTLSGNEKSPTKLQKQPSAKVTYGEHGHRPIGVEARANASSVRGKIVRGNEAFI